MLQSRFKVLLLMVAMLTTSAFMCTRYTYPLVEDGAAVATPEGTGVELAEADSLAEAEINTAKAIKQVKDIAVPVKNIWQDRIIGAALAIGCILIIVGIVMALYGGHMIKGAMLAASGIVCILCFIVLYSTMVWIQNNTGYIVAGFCTILIAALGYYGWHNKGTVHGLITSFEAQKDKVWDGDTERLVKDAQGNFQSYISKVRKSLLPNN